MRDERYEYDDLGHLRKTEQRVRHVNIVRKSERVRRCPRPTGSAAGRCCRAVPRTCAVTSRMPNNGRRISGTLNNLSVDQVAAHTGHHDQCVPRGRSGGLDEDGRGRPEQKHTDRRTPTTRRPDSCSSYEFTAFRSDVTPFTAKFTYSHTFQNGNRVVWRISDAHLGLDTTKTYDPLGRLSRERVDLQKPTRASGSDRYEERFYEYGAEGRIIFKDIRLRLSSNGPDTVPLPTPSTGQQTYVYAGNRTIATVGANRLAGATKFDFAYTPMSEAASCGTSRYVVQSGDTLIDIAQAIYGDGALWYIIADANGIVAEPDDPLPRAKSARRTRFPT